MLVSSVEQSDSVVPTYVPFLSDSFLLQFFTKYRVQLPVLYSRSLLAICFICSSWAPYFWCPRPERRPMLTLAATWRSWCYYTHVTDMLTGSHRVPRMAGLMGPKAVPPDSKSHACAYNALEALRMVWDTSAKAKPTETTIDRIINLGVPHGVSSCFPK